MVPIVAAISSVCTAACSHQAVVSGAKDPNDLPAFRWINILLDNLKTGISGALSPFDFDKYANRYLGRFY
jgi:hypothetical protein